MYKVVARFYGRSDWSKSFDTLDCASDYFRWLVHLVLDDLVSPWSVTLLKGKSPISHYKNFSKCVKSMK